MDLLGQLYMLPHWDRSCRSHFLSHSVTVYRHQTKHPSADPMKQGAWLGDHWSPNVQVTGTWVGVKNFGFTEKQKNIEQQGSMFVSCVCKRRWRLGGRKCRKMPESDICVCCKAKVVELHIVYMLKWSKKKRKFDFESLVLRKFRKIMAISHPCWYN